LLFRWRKMAHRRHGRGIVAATAAPAESTLRAAATADTARVDHALKLLAARPEVAAQPPDIGAVWISGDDIHLVLAGEETIAPPPPFETGARGTWVLPGDAVLPEVAGAVAPLPALVTLGSQPGQH